MSRNRFTYETMPGDEFADTLDALGLSYNSFARLYGTRPDTVKDWALGNRSLPPWAQQAIRSLQCNPNRIAEVRDVAAEMITDDTHRPERGPYPYQAQENDNADD